MRFLLVKWLPFLVGFVFLFSCNSGDNFKVMGHIESSEGDTLYLEHQGLGGIEKIDSVVLKSDGRFSMMCESPANPEFYRLRIGNQVVVFTVDAAGVISVSANGDNLYGTFKVEDSPDNDMIKRVDALTLEASKVIDNLMTRHKGKLMGDADYIELVDSTLNVYKEEVSKLILSNPAGAAAYYAVFQKVGGYLIFDPYDKKDYPMFGAVATSWMLRYPDTERTKHLQNFTLNALKTRKAEEHQAAVLETIPIETDAGLPDIVLREVNGDKMALSSLKGKVVLLDFAFYNEEYSPSHNMHLNAIYSKYKKRGFEIYQISLDSDDHFWKISASNLPWVTVRDPMSVNTRLLSTYNIRILPTGFIINKEGDVVKRIEDYTILPAELEKILK